MKTLTDHLATYAEYHRDRRNIATHFVGIPSIVVGVEALLARAQLTIAGHDLSAAVIVSLLAVLFYLRLDLRFGFAMASLLAFALVAGNQIASLSVGAWLGASIGIFAVGWVVQFIGHAYEGKKPAFVDDLVGLLIGPLFVTAEVAFALGLRSELHAEIIRRAGPTRTGRATSAYRST
jgi:uncharacterized membrane protein YGL010W